MSVVTVAAEVMSDSTVDLCRACASCLVSTEGWRNRPSDLLRTPAPRALHRARVSGLLLEDHRDGEPKFVALLGAYVAGGGHRRLVRYYQRLAARENRQNAVIRWAGEGELDWNGYCLRVLRVNDTSGMIANRSKDPLEYPYEPLSLEAAAQVLRRTVAPECQAFRHEPSTEPFQPDRPHLHERLNELCRALPGRNVRHDLANAQMRVARYLYDPNHGANAEDVATEIRQMAAMTLAFFGVAQDTDETAWRELDAGAAMRAELGLRRAQRDGTMHLETLEDVIYVMQALSSFQGVLTFTRFRSHLELPEAMLKPVSLERLPLPLVGEP